MNEQFMNEQFMNEHIQELNEKIKILKNASESNSISDKIDILKTLYAEDKIKNLLNRSILRDIECFENELISLNLFLFKIFSIRKKEIK